MSLALALEEAPMSDCEALWKEGCRHPSTVRGQPDHLRGEDGMAGVEGKLREGCGGRWNKEVPEMVCLLL